MIFFRIARIFTGTLLFLALLFPAAVKAQTDDGSAIGEDVAIAFFKAAGENPDFDLWAKNTRDYKRAAPARANEILDKEKQRLMVKWREYKSAEDVLDIRGNVSVELKSTLAKDGTQHYWMYLSFEAGDITYFPFEFQDYKFAVIPQQIETLMIQEIREEQLNLIRNDFGGAMSGSAYLYLQLKPVKAYMQQPYTIDNTEQWALLCDIATLSLVSMKKSGALWNYGADWYVSPATETLRELYATPSE